MNYYYSLDGKNVLGPKPLEELGSLMSRGGIPPNTQICAEGTKTWQLLATLLQPHNVPPPPPPIPETGDATGGLIPYKNPQALISYYLGIFSLIPAVGFFLAIAAMTLGILGLRSRAKRPVIKGAAHAWIGIVLSGISIGYHLLFIIALVFAKH